MKQLIILRGLPGSGKSTLAKKLVGNGIIHSTDDFHYINGEYKFQENKIARYHIQNYSAFLDSMKKGLTPIIIDNTNLNTFHCMRYVVAARNNNYEVIFREPDTPWKFDIDELTRRNTHNTPKDIIEKMFKIYEPTEILEKKLKKLL